MDQIHNRFGADSLFRACSLTEAGTAVSRAHKIGQTMINDRGDKNRTALMLSEHKELLRDRADQQDDIKKPVIDPDQIEEINLIICEAIKNGSRVTVDYYKNKRISHVEGYILDAILLKENS